MKTKKQQVEATTGVLDYLQSTLARSALLQLYAEDSRGRFVCRAVLQQLSSVSQQLVVRLSSCGGSFPTKSVNVWSTMSHKNTIDELNRWSILDPNSDQESELVLTLEFAKGLKECLTALDTSPWTSLTVRQLYSMEKEAAEEQLKMDNSNKLSRGNIARNSKSIMHLPKVTPESLELYTQSQWDAVLHFLVGTPNLQKKPPEAVIHFLMQTGLMQNDPEYTGMNKDHAPLVITQKGYDFMLQDNHQQVWHFVLQYLQSLHSHKKAKLLSKEALLLLVCLGFARVGEPYLTSQLSKKGRLMVRDLSKFGLLLVREIGTNTIFYPTRVALQLVGACGEGAGNIIATSVRNKNDGDLAAGGSSSISSMWTLSSKALNEALSDPSPENSSHLAIIVQTNFQLCAYTTSELHVSMLSLFCDLQTIRRLPNVVFMIITRDSVKSAFQLGIQAYQIIRFLEKHAHPKCRSMMSSVDNHDYTTSPVPSNVVDQIWLWDRERRRVKWHEVYSHQCLLPGEFNAVVRYALDKNALAWSAGSEKPILIHYYSAEIVQNYVRKWRAKTASRQAEADGL